MHNIMAKVKYYSEDELVQKIQSGEYGWLDFVNHHSREWVDEYEEFCRSRNLEISNTSAERFVDFKGKQFEEAMGSDA